MINKIGKITIYVNNQDEAVDFWTNKMKFVVKFSAEMGPGMKWIEVAPNNDEFTTFVLYDKKMMKGQNPNTNVGHPSILLSTDNVQTTHNEMKENGVEVTDIMKMPYGSMFTFRDQDGNSYLVRQD